MDRNTSFRRSWLLLVLCVAVVAQAGCIGISAEYDLPDPALDPVAAQGYILYQQDCQRCHKLNPNDTQRGPTFNQIALTAQERVPGVTAADYLRTSILNPGAYVVDGYRNNMPDDFGDLYSDTDLDALVAYMLTLE